MRTIWRSVLKSTDVQEIEVPEGSVFLCAAQQYNDICIWYSCEDTAFLTKRTIAIVGTSHPAPEPDEVKYLGTMFLHAGALVFHVFEQKRR